MTTPLSSFDRALATERAYFELGAEVEHLPGADLAWTPGFVYVPAGSVVHRVDASVAAELGRRWLDRIEARLLELDIRLSRIYLEARDAGVERVLDDGGYTCREELLFAHDLPDPAAALTFRPARTDEDWVQKRQFHQQVTESPDGHRNRAADLVELERHKCAHGMDSFLAELDGTVVGVVGAVWGEGTVRVKNLLVHPAHRRQSVATTMLSHVAALGRARGIPQQCLVALAGGQGEKLYRSLGMQWVGSQYEWSKPLSGKAG